MGARGPKPQPAAVKAAKAAVRSKREPRAAKAAAAPSPADAVSSGPAPPAWLKDGGLEIWRRIAPALSAAKLLSAADVEAFGRYCRNFARWLKLQAELDKDGETYESESAHGKLKRANPVFLVCDRVERQLLAAEDRFGMNPSERQRIMASRMNTGTPGDLFGEPRKAEDPAAKPQAPAQPVDSPLGLLN